jgi:uncharacterized membrane protein YfcA
LHIDLYLVLGSAVIGFLIGLTGLGGGALMTPMLVLVFGISPSAAISSDLIAALFMKPFGVAIHWKRKTIQSKVVKLLCIGSVPSAFVGTYVMHLMGESATAERELQLLLGFALIVGAAAMVVRLLGRNRHPQPSKALVVRTLPTIAIGVGGGFIVGLTSVGAGSMILVLLAMLYPNLKNNQLVGTDLAQSVPLTMGATAGTLIFGHVSFALTASIIVGSVPAVIVGSLISSRGTLKMIRPVIAGAVLLSGLKYMGLPIPALGAAAVVIAFLIVVMSIRLRNFDRLNLLQLAEDHHPKVPTRPLVAEAIEHVVTLLPSGLDRNL